MKTKFLPKLLTSALILGMLAGNAPDVHAATACKHSMMCVDDLVTGGPCGIVKTYRVKVCTRCKEMQKTLFRYENVKHSYDTLYKIVQPTCTKDGYYQKKCGRCSKVDTKKYTIPSAGKHTYSDKNVVRKVNPTCTKDGYMIVGCTGASKYSFNQSRQIVEENSSNSVRTKCTSTKKITLPKTGHKWTKVGKSNGKTKYKCSHCKKIQYK